MLDILTYLDLVGRRRLRRYVIAAGFIFIFIGWIFGWLGWQSMLAGRERSASNIPPLGNEIQPIANPKTGIPEVLNCPTNSKAWRLIEVYPGDNYKRIEPNCVMEGIARTAAWHMFVRLGHTKQEAADRLNFDRLPWQPTPSIQGLTNTKGRQVLALEMEAAQHPTYRSWIVDDEGQAALTYSLRGCYRTSTIVGSKVQSWGNYPVICVLAYDRDPGWSVHELDTQRFAIDATSTPPLRRFILFGYVEGIWVLLGEMRDQQMDIEDPDVAKQERAGVAARYGTVPWDAIWLQATFGGEMKPLPEDWRTFEADPDVIQAISQGLDAALGDFGGLP